MEKMDQAVMRRFGWKVKFSPLAASGRRRLYHRYFGKRPPKAIQRQLERIPDLTAGDFKATQQRLDVQGESGCSHQALIDALLTEASYKNPSGTGCIGFAETPE